MERRHSYYNEIFYDIFKKKINSINTKRNEAEFFVGKYVSTSFYEARNNSSLHKQFASLNIESMFRHLMNSTTRKVIDYSAIFIIFKYITYR